MYDSISSNVWRAARRRWYVVLVCALLGAAAAIALTGAGGDDVSNRFDIRFATLEDLAAVLDVAEPVEVDVRQVAAQAELDFELTDVSDEISADFLGDETARVVRVTVVGPSASVVDQATSEVQQSLTQLVVTPRLDQVDIAVHALDGELELLQGQLTELENSIDALAPDDPIRPSILLQRAETQKDLTDVEVNRSNLVAYRSFIENDLVTFDTPEVTTVSQGWIVAAIAGALVGAILSMLGFVVAVLFDHRLRRRMHIEQAAPGVEILAVAPGPDQLAPIERDALNTALSSFARRHDLDRIVVLGLRGTAARLDGLLVPPTGAELVFSDDLVLPSGEVPSDRFGCVLVAQWGRTSENEMSAGAAMLRSAGVDHLAALMVGVPRRDLAWAGASSAGTRWEAP